MKTEGFGIIRYGELKFIFEMTESVEKILRESGVAMDSLFPKTQFFYQGVLMKTGIGHEEEKELRVVYHGIRIGNKIVNDILDGDFVKFENFPIHNGKDIYFAEFGVEVQK